MVTAPVERGMDELEDEPIGLPSVEEGTLPLGVIVTVVLRVKVSVPVKVVRPGIVTIVVPKLVVCVVIVVGPEGEVELDGDTGEPSVDEEIPVDNEGRVRV